MAVVCWVVVVVAVDGVAVAAAAATAAAAAATVVVVVVVVVVSGVVVVVVVFVSCGCSCGCGGGCCCWSSTYLLKGLVKQCSDTLQNSREAIAASSVQTVIQPRMPEFEGLDRALIITVGLFLLGGGGILYHHSC